MTFLLLIAAHERPVRPQAHPWQRPAGAVAGGVSCLSGLQAPGHRHPQAIAGAHAGPGQKQGACGPAWPHGFHPLSEGSVEGALRLDLDGQPSGMVTAEQQGVAVKTLRDRIKLAKDRQKTEEAQRKAEEEAAARQAKLQQLAERFGKR